MKLKLAQFTLLLFFICDCFPCGRAQSNLQTEYVNILIELNRTITQLDQASFKMLLGLAGIADQYPQSEEVLTEVIADTFGTIAVARAIGKTARDIVLPLSAAKEKGLHVPEGLIPALAGLTLNRLVITIRVSGNSLENQWKKATEGLSEKFKRSGPEVRAEIDLLVNNIFETIQSAVRPLKQLLSEVQEGEELETIKKEFEQIKSKQTQNVQIIFGGVHALSISLGRWEHEQVNQILQDWGTEVQTAFSYKGAVDANKLTEELKDHFSKVKLRRLPSRGLDDEKLWEYYEDAILAEVYNISLQHVRLAVQEIKDFVDTQQPFIDAVKQKHYHGDAVQLVTKMLHEFKAAHQRYVDADAKLRNASDENAHKVQIAIKAAEVTSTAIIRDALASALTAKNDTEIFPLFAETTTKLKTLTGHAEQMVQVIEDSENKVVGGKSAYELVQGFGEQIQAATEVVKIASAVHNVTRKVQLSLGSHPAQLHRVNGVIKAAVQNLFVRVLEALRDVREKKTVGGEIYSDLYDKVEKDVDAMATALIQYIFDVNSRIPSELVNEISGVLDELVSAFHTYFKPDFSRVEL